MFFFKKSKQFASKRMIRHLNYLNILSAYLNPSFFSCIFLLSLPFLVECWSSTRCSRNTVVRYHSTFHCFCEHVSIAENEITVVITVSVTEDCEKNQEATEASRRIKTRVFDGKEENQVLEKF
jgi:hypothetical protein